MSQRSPEARRRQRQRWHERKAAELDGLKAHGASCSNCGAATRKQSAFICGMDSDFYGQVTVQPGDLCRHWFRLAEGN